MTQAQKVFLLIAVMYLTFKLVLGVIMGIVIKRIEAKGIEHKKRREELLKTRRMKNLELYRRQYQQCEERSKDLTAV